MKIKICGITNIEDAKLSCNLGANALGFIFYKKSKRYIQPEDVKKIIQQLPPFITKVGVFVNEQIEYINKISKEINLNVIQLHGDEPPESIINIDLPVIKAFRVDDDFDYSILNQYSGCAFLLDAYDKNDYGGTGKKFMWNKIPTEIKSKIILAGGIWKDDIPHIVNEIKPYAIDVSSSLEIEPGKKDKQKLIEFFSLFYTKTKLVFGK